MVNNTVIENLVMAEQLPGCILIVDDDQDVLDALRDLLIIEGNYYVETATDVLSVKNKLNNFNPDIALLDVRLGNANGLDLISLLKDELPDIDCIMMTAHHDVEYAVKALRYGAAEYLFKPIAPARLLNAMDDLFHKHRIKQEQHSKEQNLKTILGQTSGFIFLLSPTGLCMEASHAALSYIDQQWDEIAGKAFWETPWLQHSNLDSKKLRSAIVAASSGQTSRLEVEIADFKGCKSCYEFSLRPVIEHDKQISLIIVEGHDLTEHKQIEQKLKTMASHDPLTGLANRTLLHEHLENVLARSARNNQKFSVIFIDLDHFKEINDSLGHQVGDELLINVSKCLKDCMRDEDIIGRIGGDEFVIVLSSESDGEGSCNAVKRLMQSISEMMQREDHGDVVSASIGIAVYPDDGNDASTLLHNADAAMYMAKKKGRNCFQYYGRQ